MDCQEADEKNSLRMLPMIGWFKKINPFLDCTERVTAESPGFSIIPS